MKKTISIITEEFENEKTGERVEGITIMVDGAIKELFDIIKREKKEYSNNVSIVQDALMKGLEEIKNTIFVKTILKLAILFLGINQNQEKSGNQKKIKKNQLKRRKQLKKTKSSKKE